MKKILKRATACLLAVLMLAGEATVQVAAIDSNGNGTTKTVSYVATHNYTVYYLDLKGMCYIMRDKGIGCRCVICQQCIKCDIQMAGI